MLDLKPLRELSNKQMSRRQFLAHVGAALIAVVGISALLRNITDSFSSKSQDSKVSKKGNPFGGGSYGA